MTNKIIIAPQPGPQTDFLTTSATICIYGGSAGSGKTYALLLEPLRNINNPNFSAIIFRRNATQIRNQGGLWSTSLDLYSQLGAKPREAYLDWRFPSGATIKFAHLQDKNTVLSYQGSQIPLIMWDELTHFESTQFWYMMSRLRSTSGVAGYMRAATNPEADSFVRELIDWWIGEDGYPIMDRSGVLRWFVRHNDATHWASSKEELISRFPDQLPTSFTFIPAKLQDNKILMEKDPTYLANLHALSRVDRLKLLGGNWDVKESAGMFFQREWFPILDIIPSGWNSSIRFWDRGATKPHEGNKDPDWTRGLRLYRYPDNTYLVADLKSLRDTPGQVEKLIKNVASHDGHSVRVMSQQDPGSAGVAEAENFIRMLSGWDVRTVVLSKDKITRAKPVSAQAEAGNIRVLRAPWNEEFFTELENFPNGKHDDICDTISGAFNELSVGHSIMDVFQLMNAR